jgi:hypothetical protein
MEKITPVKTFDIAQKNKIPLILWLRIDAK